ncbi:MAG: CRTAC1 family protein, partial [Planctomycetota bacterium]|nr:CRTAC1 family protein [Planctomycetota bacterium]
NGAFTNVAVAAGVDTSNPSTQDGWSANFADYDLDGDLDLFVTGFELFNTGSKLFRNNGNGTFTDVTPISGTGGAPMFQGVASIFGFTPLLIDMDGDRYPELIYIGDFGSSRYFKNNGDGTFTDWTFQADAGQEENGMGGNVGDFNNDGKMDFYATSILGPSMAWTGNKLYKNVSSGVGDHDFDEIADTAGVDDGGYGWGSVLIDFNHDTRLDIIAASQESSNYEGSAVFQNLGNENFNDITNQSGLVHNGDGRSLLNFDYDNDGDQDIVIASNNDFLQLYRNDLPALPATRWLRIFLDPSTDPTIPPDGIGSFVKATIGRETLTRVVHAGGFEGSSELSAHFGLGTAGAVDSLRVEWSNGAESTFTNVAANQTLTLPAPPSPTCSMQGDVDNDALVNGSDMPGFIRAKMGEPPGQGEAPDCADYGTGTVAGDVFKFVSDLLS